jgi:2-amino-4-hydroxy-6-hydroxymethyldihydropteridine diphosphokinase
MNTAFLITGGNIGDRMEYLHRAEAAIAADCGIISRSSGIYETEAWGKKDQNSFLNQALELQTSLSAFELLDAILQIEEKLGRKRSEKYGPRLIDIDILFFNHEVIHTDHLKVPHPHLQNRRFVLQCLNEIAPHYIHPVLHKDIQQLLAACEDNLKVVKFA